MPARGAGSRFISLAGSVLVPTVLAAFAWVALVEWRPTTTWHLAPALVAGAGAWVAAQGEEGRMPHAQWGIGATALLGFAVAWGEVELLQAHGRLGGPALFGGNVVFESVATAALSSAIAAYIGIRRVKRTLAEEVELRRVGG